MKLSLHQVLVSYSTFVTSFLPSPMQVHSEVIALQSNVTYDTSQAANDFLSFLLCLLVCPDLVRGGLLLITNFSS